MNLLQMRTKFRDLSGRYDLVNDDFSDNGADFFINEGRKFLDRLDETQKSWAVRLCRLDANAIYATFPYCRAIKEVWVTNPTEGRWQLEKKDLQDLMDGYLMTLPDEMKSGNPLYYSPCITRYSPTDPVPASFETLMGYVEVASSNYNAILLDVPSSDDITLIINGLFYSDELTLDDDVNYWSEVHPMLLYMSTMRQIEIVNRSTQGVNDWTNSIMAEMRQLGMDLVEEVIAEVDQMEG